jgi:hypothetical protein
MDKYVRDVTVVTWIGPAILGAVLGIIAYRVTASQPGSFLLAALYVLGGVVLVSLLARLLRQVITPDNRNDADL